MIPWELCKPGLLSQQKLQHLQMDTNEIIKLILRERMSCIIVKNKVFFNTEGGFFVFYKLFNLKPF